MNELPIVSVIIPTRARAPLLRRAIQSVLRQTFQNFEILVVLDGQDSVTAKTLAQFDEPRIRLIALDQLVGAAEARNIGARKARGTYIALLDDDDEWLPTKLQAQWELAESHSGSSYVVVTQYVYRREAAPDEIWPAHLPRTGEPLSEFLFASCGGFQTSTYFCLRELLLRIPFTRHLKKHQDWDWFLQLAALPGFQLLIVPQPLSIYWVPARSRTSISGSLDWEFSHRWATSRRSLMTGKAYARFLVKICTRSAMMQNAGPPALFKIFRDLLFHSRPTPFLLAEFCVSALVPDTLRQRLRPSLQSWRKIRPTLSAG